MGIEDLLQEDCIIHALVRFTSTEDAYIHMNHML